MNRLGRWILNTPPRAFIQRHYLLPTFHRLGCPLEGRLVLEVGCGRGIGMELIHQAGAARVDGIDLDPVMARLANQRMGTRTLMAVADIAALPMPQASYDVVIDFGSIHLMPDWHTGLAEVARVLRPGGHFCFEQPAHPLYRLLMPLTTGRHITGGFRPDVFLDALDMNGLHLLALARPHPLALAGLLGDLVGLATKPAA
jgi:SAM-dependent methyltransferase